MTTVLLIFSLPWSIGEDLKCMNVSLISQQTKPIRQHGFVEQWIDVLANYPDLLGNRSIS